MEARKILLMIVMLGCLSTNAFGLKFWKSEWDDPNKTVPPDTETVGAPDRDYFARGENRYCPFTVISENCVIGTSTHHWRFSVPINIFLGTDYDNADYTIVEEMKLWDSPLNHASVFKVVWKDDPNKVPFSKWMELYTKDDDIAGKEMLLSSYGPVRTDDDNNPGDETIVIGIGKHHWGKNVITPTCSGDVSIKFDPVGHPDYIEYEACVRTHDSGTAQLIKDNNQWKLVGIASSQMEIRDELDWIYGCIEEAAEIKNLNKKYYYDTIQEAINDANDGDVIELPKRTYSENIDFLGKAITLQSRDPYNPEVREETIIEGTGTGSTVTFSAESGGGATLIGITITCSNGHGVFCSLSSPTISNCVIRNCSNAGINCYWASPEIKNCIITGCNNGIRSPSFSSPQISNCKIYDNVNRGVWCLSSTATIKNNWIYNNSRGIGVRSNDTSVISNNTVVGNKNYGIEKETGSPVPTITNCILWGNGDDIEGFTASYSCIEDGDAGTGNISSDPCFANYYDFRDETTADGEPNTIKVTDSGLYDVGDIIEYDNDGVARTITAILDATTVKFSPDLDGGESTQGGVLIYYWGSNTDVAEDYNLDRNSLCIDVGDSGGTYAGQVDMDGDERVMDMPDKGDGLVDVDIGADEYGRVSNITRKRQYKNINNAIDEASNSDILVADPGTYNGAVDLDGKTITVRSINPLDWDIVEQTVIDGGEAYAAVEGMSDSVLSGFRIRGGLASCIDIRNSTPTISNCLMKEGDISGTGGIGIFDCSPTIRDCRFIDYDCTCIWVYSAPSGSPVITNCQFIAYDGQGSYPIGVRLMDDSDATITNCEFKDNYNGIQCNESSTIIKNCNIYGNKSYQGDGAGIFFWGSSSLEITNCTLVNNDKGITDYDGSSEATVSNCIIWDNGDEDSDNLVGDFSSVTYSCVGGGYDGEGNIDSDPCFVDAASNDYHLRPDSPCINEGDPLGNYDGQTDIDGEPRIIGEYVDMGVDETNFLLSSWRFDEGSGQTTEDEIGSNNGTLNGPAWIMGPVYSALEFDGIDDIVEIDGGSGGTSYQGIKGASDRTVCAWIKRASDNWGGIVSWGDNSVDGASWDFLVDGAGFLRVSVTGGYAHSQHTLSVGFWHHVAVTFANDGSPNVADVRLYIDGKEEGLDVGVHVINTVPDVNVRIGRSEIPPYTMYFDGLIDNVKIFCGELSSKEVKELYESEHKEYMVSYWRFDEGSGGTAYDSIGSNDGTLTSDLPDPTVELPEWKRNGKGKGSLKFTGYDKQYVQMEGYKGITGTYDRSCAAWIKTTGYLGGGDIISWGDESSQYWLLSTDDNGNLSVSIGDGIVKGTEDLRDSQWHHVAATWDPAWHSCSQSVDNCICNAKLYVDGEEIQTTPPDTHLGIDTAIDMDVKVGVLSTDLADPNYFHGNIDEVKLFGIALSSDYIKELYETGHLVSHWRFDDCDYIGGDDIGSNDGTLKGPHWTPGKIGGALEFDGLNDYVVMSGYKGITGTNARSCSAWIQTEATGDIISWGDESSQFWLFYLDGYGRLRVSLNNGVVRGLDDLRDGQWHHVAATWDPSWDFCTNHIVRCICNGRLYVDGEEIATETPSNKHLSVDTGIDMDVKAGLLSTGNARYFDGKIDELRVLTRALSSDEIEGIYEAELD